VFRANGYVTVLTATECAGLRRYDIPDTMFPPAFPSTYDAWDPVTIEGTHLFLRDIEIHEGLATPRAFVAVYRGGIYAFDLPSPTSGGGLVEAGGGWPFEVANDTFHHGLALDPQQNRLVVAAGPALKGEIQHFGDCSIPIACDGSGQASPSNSGIYVYGSVHTTAPVQEASLGMDDTSGLPIGGAPVNVAIRPNGATSYYLDVASDVQGLQVVEGRMGPFGWTLTVRGAYGADDEIPTGPFDDLVVYQDVLYGANEGHISTYRVTSAPTFLDQPLAVVTGSGVGAITFAPDVPTNNPRVFGAKHDGIAYYDVGANKDDPPFLGLLENHGRASTCLALPGYGGQNPWWLYVPNQVDDFQTLPNRGGVRVFNVTRKTPAEAVELGRWLDTTERALIDLRAVASAGNEHAVWVSYSPVEGGTDVSLGILVLKATYTTNPKEEGVPLVGRMHHDASANRLYVALGCDGIAMYHVSNPLTPTLIAHRSTPGKTALHLRPTPWSSAHVLISFLTYGDGVALLDASTASAFTTATMQTIQNRFQATVTLRDPLDSNSFTVGDARGGVHHVKGQ
jgi:hypothetical protein